MAKRIQLNNHSSSVCYVQGIPGDTVMNKIQLFFLTNLKLESIKSYVCKNKQTNKGTSYGQVSAYCCVLNFLGQLE